MFLQLYIADRFITIEWGGYKFYRSSTGTIKIIRLHHYLSAVAKIMDNHTQLLLLGVIVSKHEKNHWFEFFYIFYANKFYRSYTVLQKRILVNLHLLKKLLKWKFLTDYLPGLNLNELSRIHADI